MWLSEPFDRARAWIDLLLLANHQDGYFRVRGVRVNIKRGQVGYGVVALAKRWKWSRGKVKRFLDELESDQQICQQKNNVTTLITITNYDAYQKNKPANDTANETAGEQQIDSKRTQTIKDNNNSSNGNKIKKKKFSNNDLSIAESIFQKIFNVAPKTKQPDFDAWADIIRLMRIQDGLTHSEIMDVFSWANSDKFWSTNILSPKKLRKHFPSLHAQSTKTKTVIDKHSGFTERDYAAGATPEQNISWMQK